MPNHSPRTYGKPVIERSWLPLPNHSPRTYGKPTSLWTLELAAEVSVAQGLTAEPVTGETIRATLARLGVQWQRARDWLTSPDPEDAREKARATG